MAKVFEERDPYQEYLRILEFEKEIFEDEDFDESFDNIINELLEKPHLSEYKLFQLAIEEENIHIINKLIKKNFDINSQNSKGYCHSILHLACKKGNEDIVGLLLENNAILDLTNKYNETPFIKSVQYGHKPVIDLLISKNADINARDINGNTALHILCQEYNEYDRGTIIEKLISCNADVDIFNNVDRKYDDYLDKPSVKQTVVPKYNTNQLNYIRNNLPHIFMRNK
eukprot:TRINITY_DN11291_c0_g1_i1.p1 TRINITY_DN11291_c0_g1~~TRINITY_DN11291_c0_g1_i1.p1  ORF type:complete len:228 (+),score=49.95 TRINITY_DN11291_c0_g1_i1:94-777(+)